jgi:hypothetical protein
MRKFIVVLTALVAALALGAVPAGAITDGELDGNRHPHVGLMVAIGDVTLRTGEVVEDVPLWRCSGTAMSPTVFLTAGHCTEAPAAHVEIWFAPGPIPTDPDYAAAVEADADGLVSCNDNPALFDGYPCQGDVGGTPQTHPSYNPDAFFLFDLGVVVYDDAFARPTYGDLPSLNQLDAFDVKGAKKDVTFTSVGYGLQKSFPGPASWKNEASRVRMLANPRLIQINQGIVGDFALLLSNNSNTGGTCFGDSGGPNFIGDSNVIAGVTSFGLNVTCGGVGGVYRVDRADDLTWLATFGLS